MVACKQLCPKAVCGNANEPSIHSDFSSPIELLMFTYCCICIATLSASEGCEVLCRLREKAVDKERAERKALEKERAKLIRTDNEVEDEDEDSEPWMRKSLHGRCDVLTSTMLLDWCANHQDTLCIGLEGLHWQDL